MSDLESKIINKLLTKYESSCLSKEGSLRNLKIKIDINDSLFKDLRGIDSYKYKDSYDLVLKKLENNNFINTYYSKDFYFEYLTLNIDNVDSLYNYANLTNPIYENESVINYLNSLELDGYLNDFKNYIIKHIETKYRIPKNYFDCLDELKTLILILTNINKLNEEVMKRDFSVKVLNDSKRFVKYENKVINIIKDFDSNSLNIEKEDILKSYNIVSNYSYTLIKNKLIFKLGDTIIDLNKLPYEFSLSNKMIKDLTIIKNDIQKIITVENLTSFYKLEDDSALIIYLAGFSNSVKHELLKKIYNVYPNAYYYHFSDIDCGGFYIFNNLKLKTNINFIPYKMSKEELINNKDNLKTLTENDRKKLLLMVNNNEFSLFKDTIEYMLKNNCKLEQEILD